MKLKETIGFNTDGEPLGIFTVLKANTSLSFLNDFDISNLDYEYYFGRSGEKEISILFNQLIELSISDTLSVKIQIALSKLSTIINNRYSLSWNRIYKALTEEYNPIHNYNVNETEELNDTETLTGNTHNEQNTLIENTNSRAGFNSISLVEESKNIEQGNVDNNYQDEESNSTKDSSQERTLTRSGNIGVTTTQKMIREELEVRKYQFIEEVMRDIDKVLCSKIRIYS